jgi:hypothetical protein
MLSRRSPDSHEAQRPSHGVAARPGLAGCTLTPIAAGLAAAQAWSMVQLAIRCHPRIPISSDELEGWLELDPNEPLLAGDRLPQALRDMRLLGLQPTLLTPHTNGQAT